VCSQYSGNVEGDPNVNGPDYDHGWGYCFRFSKGLTCVGCGDASNGDSLPQPMSSDEMADLSREAGRELTTGQAVDYLLRRTHELSVRNMLRETDSQAVARMLKEINK
jgi:hypothetical protein